MHWPAFSSRAWLDEVAVRIGILFNCQHESLGIALRALLPDADVVSFELNSVLHDEAGRMVIASALAACDHVVSLDIAPGYGPLSTRVLHPTTRRFHLLPPLHFGGFHPDSVSVRIDGVPLPSGAGSIHSRIVLAAFLAGMTAQEASELFNTLVFARLSYLQAMAEHTALLIEKYAAYAIDVSPLAEKWRAGGCFMHSTHHPKMVVFLDLARVICAMMGIVPQADPPATALRDPLAPFATTPFMAEIAARCGMQPDGVFRDNLPSLPVSLADYVQVSFACLNRAPLSCLRAVQGVPEALARLGLAAVPRPPRASSLVAGGKGLLSWHGTILRIEAASSLLVHERLYPPSADCSDFLLEPQPCADGTWRADILGGLNLAPAFLAGTVCLRRQGRAMVAEPTSLAVPFKGSGQGHDEAFLVVDVQDIAHLRAILAQDWIWQETGRRAAAARIRLGAGFILDFGIFAVNLLEAPITPAGEHGFTLQTLAGPITLQRADQAAGKREIALLADPRRRMADDAGSIPEFCTKPDVSWLLAAGEEILHPPITAEDRDTAWMFERCTAPGGLAGGLQQHAATLRRMPGRMVLLSPGLEGMLFDADGAMAAYPAPSLALGRTLPAGLRLEEGALLIEADCMAAAPVIETPAAICLTPDWRSQDGWLIEVALRLHAMAPFLPRGAHLLVPPGFEPGDRLAMLDALGLGPLPVLEAPAPICRLADAVWLDAAGLDTMPAALLAGFRARIAALFPAPAGEATRLYIKRSGVRSIAQNDVLDLFLATQNITTIVPEELAPAERIAAFRGADMVIGTHGEDLANIVFCQAGTRVLEISPRGQFRPRYWVLAEKCGLIHGVLPCATQGGGFDSTVQVDVGRLRGLFRALRLMTEK